MDQVELRSCIKALRIPLVLEHFAEYVGSAANEQWSRERNLYELLNNEREAGNERRIEALFGMSKLLFSKTLDTRDCAR